MRILQTITVSLFLAVAGGGCCCLRGLEPCEGPHCAYTHPDAGCGIVSCGEGIACGDGFADSCGVDIPSCGAPVVDSCGSCGLDPCTCGRPPTDCQTCAAPGLSLCPPNLLHALFGCTGCDGEFYWSEWFNDPPDCCDPCDDHGYWTGPGGPVVSGGFPPMVAEAPSCSCGMH